MDDLELAKNTGVIDIDRDTDFLAGSESAIKHEIRLKNGDWEKYNGSDEWQRRKVGNNLGYDTLSCVTFSAVNCVEMQIMYLLENGLIDESTKKYMEHLGYFDETGRVNFSEWFSANVNGTTKDGNYLQAAWDSFRKDGLLSQKDGKHVNDFNSQEEWLDKTAITDAMRAKAKMFNTLFDVSYEWVVRGVPYQWGTFDHQSKHAPLHVSVPTCKGWNNKGEVPICEGVTVTNHAISYIGKSDEYKKILDHYTPFVKKLNNNYYIPRALKGVVTVKKEVAEAPKVLHVFNKQLKYGMPISEEVKALQNALQTLKMPSGKPYMTVGVYGRYGDITRAALGQFQTDNKIVDPDGQGTNFGPQTRAAMNAKLAIHT